MGSWEPLSMSWYVACVETVGATGFAVSMLLYASFDFCSSRVAGRIFAVLLALSILQTLAKDLIVRDDPPHPSSVSTCGALRSVCSVLLLIALCTRCYKVERGGSDLVFEDLIDIAHRVLFLPVSVTWIAGYTMWNVLLCVENYGLRGAMPALAACLGAGFLYWRGTGDRVAPYAHCWLYARVVTLAFFMTVDFWFGLFVDAKAPAGPSGVCSVDHAAFTVAAISIILLDVVASVRGKNAADTYTQQYDMHHPHELPQS